MSKIIESDYEGMSIKEIERSLLSDVDALKNKVFPAESGTFKHNALKSVYKKGRYEPPQKTDFIKIKQTMKCVISHMNRIQREKKKRDKESRRKKNTNLRLVKIKPNFSKFLNLDKNLDGIFSDTLTTAYLTSYFFNNGLKDNHSRQYVYLDETLVNLFRSGLLEEKDNLKSLLSKSNSNKDEKNLKDKLNKVEISLKEMDNKRGPFIHLQRWLSPLFEKDSKGVRIQLTPDDLDNYDELYSILMDIKNDQRKIKDTRDEIQSLIKKRDQMVKEKFKLDQGKNNKYDECVHQSILKNIDDKFDELDSICEDANMPCNIKKIKNMML